MGGSFPQAQNPEYCFIPTYGNILNMSDQSKQELDSGVTNTQRVPHPSSKDTLKFESSVIGIKTTKRQDPFAEQNKRAAKQQKEDQKKRKIAAIVLSIVGGVVVVGLVIWLIVFLIQNFAPDESATGTVVFSSDTVTQDMTDLGNLANSAFGGEVTRNDEGEIVVNGNMDAADTVFDKTINFPQNQDFTNQINLSRIKFYQDNGRYDLVINYLEQIDPEKLSVSERASYYNIASITYHQLGDDEKSEEYLRLAQNAQVEMGEFGG